MGIDNRVSCKPGRLYDVSEAVARYLGFLEQGLAEVEVAVLNDPPANGDR